MIKCVSLNFVFLCMFVDTCVHQVWEELRDGMRTAGQKAVFREDSDGVYDEDDDCKTRILC